MYKIKLICRLTLLLVVGLQNLKEDVVLIISNFTDYNLLRFKIIEYYIDCFSLFSPFSYISFNKCCLTQTYYVLHQFLYSLKVWNSQPPFDYLNYNKVLKNSYLEANFLWNEWINMYVLLWGLNVACEWQWIEQSPCFHEAYILISETHIQCIGWW